MFEIEKNVPMPMPIRKYPLDRMEVGDSFLIPVDGADDPEKVRNRLAMRMRELRPKKFITRGVTDGIRVWRAE